MKYSSLIFLFISITSSGESEFKTIFESSNGTKSASYDEGIKWWSQISKEYDELNIQEYGMTDAGLPLHTITLSQEGSTLEKLGNSNKAIILINNAIHPGEPDGVDASMMLFRDIIQHNKNILDSCILVCIPYYNIGGALNRSGTSRANQNGPESYGFRGNAQNLDLNRDFIKCDSRNAQSFAKLLQLIDPDVYIETHVSNGADYQYNLTYLSTQPDKLGGEMGKFLREEMNPSIAKMMSEKENPIVPYVNHHNGPLSRGYPTFYDSPRYSSGLTTLHHIYGFITESHMLKPYDVRVKTTYEYLNSVIDFTVSNKTQLQRTRAAQKKVDKSQINYPIDWEIDKFDLVALVFKGYEYSFKKSEVTGVDRLFYDQTKPKTMNLFYAHAMLETQSEQKPKAYILKKGYEDVADRLRWNGVLLEQLTNDTIIQVITTRILDYETVKSPYEKHYLHSKVKTKNDTAFWSFNRGDYIIQTGKSSDRFLIETLSPTGPDSYFNWNFFDAILQQKEGFSSYVFEDQAADLLSKDAKLKSNFKKMREAKMGNGEELSSRKQLNWIYRNSVHYEKEHNTLPVFKVL